MTTQPKLDSPEYYWFNPILELQALNEPTDPRNQTIAALLFGEIDNVLLDVGAFCASAQPAAVNPVVTDFESDNYVTVMSDYAAASVYYNLCEETTDVVALLTVNLDSSQIQTLGTTPVNCGFTPASNQIIVPIAVQATYKFGTVDYAGAGLQLQDSAGNPLFISSGNLTGGGENVTDQLYQPENYNFALTAIIGQDLQIYSSESFGSAGDGTMQIDIFYSIITIA